MRAESDLDALAADFAARGCGPRSTEGEHPGLGRALHVSDPFGFPLEFFHAIEQFDTQLQRFDLQHGAPIARIDHVNLHSPDVEATFRFWKSLGFRCTEYISTDGDDERITGAWLARKPTVHDVALTAGGGPRLHHLGFAVPDTVGVLRACDQLAAAGHAASIERGPGRHGVSNAFFVYLRDPVGPSHRAVRLRLLHGRPRPQAAALVGFGRELPLVLGHARADRWYEESSVRARRRRAAGELRAAGVDERDSFRGEVAQLG